MPIAAVPRYIGDDWETASPGMKFGFYLPLWDADTFKLMKDEHKRKAYSKASTLGQDAKNQLAGLLVRQSALADSYGDSILSLSAKSTAPFSTGLGNEHPLENGFSFLNPYGLPYLAGSGVKGVLRQAARELAGLDCEYVWDLDSDWNQATIDALFGKEDSDDAQRGALQFWDVIPDLKVLKVEVMTAHQSHYYQDRKQPHDSGDPNPLNFLAVPEKTDFCFHVVCDRFFLRRLAPELENQWQDLLEKAFEHAFEWLGFGAKTAVGYGAMERDLKAEENVKQEAKEAREREKESNYLATLSPLERNVEVICKKEQGNNPGVVLLNKLEAGEWENSEDRCLVAAKIRSLWQAEKNWNPEFSGKNKAKVKQKKRCETVVGYLKA